MRVRICATPAEAVADVFDGATIFLGGFGRAGVAFALVEAVAEKGVRNLTAVSNNCGTDEEGIALLHKNGQVRKMIASFPASKEAYHFERRFLAGECILECVPQGTLAERIRAGGAGIRGFYTPTAVGTLLAEGKEVRTFDGVECVLERPMRADFALIHAHTADTLGNLAYRLTSRNFNPIMAAAAAVTIVEAEHIVEAGEIDPEHVVTPGIYVDRIVEVARRGT